MKVPWFASFLLASLAFNLPAQHVGVHSHAGMCDASAAIALSSDRFVVGNDEDNVLRVYRRGADGVPLFQLDLDRFLHVDPKKPEADLEGAARIGSRIYWITSHGRNKDGEFRESRNRFFATRVIEIGGETLLEPEGRPYHFLLRDLIRHEPLQSLNLAASSQLAPKEDNALNIEGISAGPEGHLWIAFRNPIPGGKAMVVPILNPEEVIQGRRCELGDPVFLELGGYGIRDMVWDENHFWLIAGAHDGKGSSRMVRWAGPEHAPQVMNAISFNGFNPEAIVPFPNRPDRLLLLSDDGNRSIGGEKCKEVKDSRLKYFRSQWVQVGDGFVQPVTE